MTPVPSSPRPRRWPIWGVPAAALAALVLFTIIFEAATKGESVLIKPENLLNILRQVSFVGIIAIGMTLVITLGGIDLSVGSLVAFLGGIGVLLMNAMLARGAGQWTSVIAAFGLILAAGVIAGALNGVLVAKGKLAPFIATLGGLAAYRSLAMAFVAGGEYRSSSAGVFELAGSGGIPIPGTNIAPRAPVPIPLTLPWPVLVFALAAVVGWIIINRTRLGRYIIAIGSNERAARYSGILVDRVKIATYSLLGLATGVSALLSASRLNSVSSSSSGSLYELDAIAAVVIGGTRMRGGSGVIAGTVIGALILGVIQNMLNLLQVSVYLQGLVKGLIIVGAALLQRAESDSAG
ncbi:MAG TPA: ABC transporter permease [Terriglobia bacterium]|nr:ABC transporter permease [Terriglobia bacterium]